MRSTEEEGEQERKSGMTRPQGPSPATPLSFSLPPKPQSHGSGLQPGPGVMRDFHHPTHGAFSGESRPAGSRSPPISATRASNPGDASGLALSSCASCGRRAAEPLRAGLERAGEARRGSPGASPAPTSSSRRPNSHLKAASVALGSRLDAAARGREARAEPGVGRE